jgi:hypothetical protein
MAVGEANSRTRETLRQDKGILSRRSIEVSRRVDTSSETSTLLVYVESTTLTEFA